MTSTASSSAKRADRAERRRQPGRLLPDPGPQERQAVDIAVKEKALTVVRRGRFGAELNVQLRTNFGSDAPPFEVQTSTLLSLSDLRHLINTLTSICDDTEEA